MNKRALALWACLLGASVSAVANNYTVKSGDNDEKIARSLGISAQELRRLNPGIDWNRLQPGQKLKTSASAAKKSTTPAKGRHTVAAGENSWTISQRYGISESVLKQMNPNVEFSPLRIGAVLVVPQRGSTGPATAPSKPATKPVTAATPAPANRPKITTPNIITSRDSVILRSKPSTEGKRVRTLDRNTIAKIVKNEGDWYQIELSGGTLGWVRGDMVTGTTRAVPAPRPVTTTPPNRTRTTSSASALISTARSLTGVRYVWGGTSRRGFDCSGFVGYVFRQHGINLPRTSAAQAGVGTPVSRGSLQAGDLVFFRTRGSRISHVGIYVGGNRFIHASSGGGRIRENELTGYYARTYAGARRVSNRFAVADTARMVASAVDEPSFTPDPEPLPEPISPRSNLGADTIVR